MTFDAKQQRLKPPSYVSLGRDGRLTIVVEGRALPRGGYLVEQVSEAEDESPSTAMASEVESN